jgi:hypothetical protein
LKNGEANTSKKSASPSWAETRSPLQRLDVGDLHARGVDAPPDETAHQAARTRRTASDTRATDGM